MRVVSQSIYPMALLYLMRHINQAATTRITPQRSKLSKIPATTTYSTIGHSKNHITDALSCKERPCEGAPG